MVSISPWMGCDEWDVMLVKPFTGHCTECTVPTAINCCDCWPGPHVTHRQSSSLPSHQTCTVCLLEMFPYLFAYFISFLSLSQVHFDLFDKLLGLAHQVPSTKHTQGSLVSQFKLRMNVSKQGDTWLCHNPRWARGTWGCHGPAPCCSVPRYMAAAACRTVVTL